MRRNLNAPQFGQGGDLAGFGEAAHVGWWQIENRRGTLVDQTSEIFQALKVFSCRNGDRGGRGHFGHFIHAAGGRRRLFDPEEVIRFERFAGRDGSFGTALAMPTVDQVHFVAGPFTKATEDHFVVGDVLLRSAFFRQPHRPCPPRLSCRQIVRKPTRDRPSLPHRVAWPGLDPGLRQASSFSSCCLGGLP